MGQEPIIVKPFTINTPNLPSNIGIQNTPAECYLGEFYS